MTQRSLRVLVVDDEDAMREVLDARISMWGYDVSLAGSCAQATELAQSTEPQIVVSDVVLPDGTGIELLERLRENGLHCPTILITAYGSIDTAVEAMKQGARDFLTKPLDYEHLEDLLDEMAQEAHLVAQAEALKKDLRHGAGLGLLVGTSKPQLELYELTKTLASNDATVIVAGESGTGKELVARTIHSLSSRSQGPFVPVNVAAIPEGLTEGELIGFERGAFTGAVAAKPGVFELAHGGVLFLDELIEMPLSLQPKVLRILEDGQVRRLGGTRELPFDVRVIAATNRDPQEAVDKGHFRADLYYRLNVFTLVVAPLRDRVDDIPLLAQHFLEQFNQRHGTELIGMQPAAIDLLRKYRWPGNVRELRNVIERAAILAKGNAIEPAHLPPYLTSLSARSPEGIVLPHGVTSAEAEKILILETLKQVSNNKAEAARRLGLDVKTIRNKMKTYDE